MLLGLSGCPDPPHVPAPPWVTTDQGGCTVLPDPEQPNHAKSEKDCESSEPDDEPNGGLFTAIQLKGCSVQIQGRLAAGDDVDVYAISHCRLPFLKPGDLASRATEEPRVMVHADDGSEVCLFASCELGPTGLVGCPGEVTDASPGGDPTIVRTHLAEGMLGCCRRGSGLLATNVACDDFSPAMTGFIVIRSVAPPKGETVTCHQNYQATFSIEPPP
jgi:hypothetical protein